MAIDTLVKELGIINPKEAGDILARIKAYEKEKDEECVVLLIQNNLGGIYRIKTRSDAYNMINNHGKVEWGVEVYDKAYLSNLRNRLRDKSKNFDYRGRVVHRSELTMF